MLSDIRGGMVLWHLLSSEFQSGTEKIFAGPIIVSLVSFHKHEPYQ